MDAFTLILIAIICSYFVVAGFVDTGRVFRFPFLFCAAVMIWTLPTAYTTFWDRSIINDQVYTLAITNAGLCLIGALIGYHCVSGCRKAAHQGPTLDSARLFTANLPSLLLGIGASLYVLRIGVDVEEWRGWPVYAIFVARFLRPALLVSLIATLLRPTKWKWSCVVVATFIPVYAAVVYFRRSDVFFTLLLTGIALNIVRGWKVPRLAVPLAMGAAFFVAILFPNFRSDPYKASNITGTVDSFEEVQNYLSGERSNEFIEGALTMDAIRQSGLYGWGTGFFNQFVSQYVPRGLVGEDFKDSLLVGQFIPVTARYLVGFDYYKPYLSPSGFTQAFCEFGWGGGFLLAGFGWLIAKLEYKAFSGTSIFWLLLHCYCAVMVPFSVYGSLTEIPTLLVPVAIVFAFASYRSSVQDSPKPKFYAQSPAGLSAR